MNRVASLLIVLVLTLAATWLLGWWGVPLIALIAGATWWARPRAIGAMAAIAWALLLVWDSLGGRLGALTSVIGGVMRVPGAMVLVLTLVIAFVLGWSAAVVGEQGRAALGAGARRAARSV